MWKEREEKDIEALYEHNTAIRLKEKYISATPVERGFPYAPHNTGSHLLYTKKTLGVTEVVWNSEKAISRLDSNMKERISKGFKTLQIDFGDEDACGHLDERGLQDLFTKFLRTVLQPETKTEAFVSIGGCELDIRLSNLTKPREPIFSFIEMKVEHSELEAAVPQAAIYAYMQCFGDGDTSIEAIGIGVSVPDFHARVGLLKLRLKPKTFELVHSELKMGSPFYWRTVEGARKLITLLISTPRELTTLLPRRRV
ncbi:MAG: uncharacterized protein A8A55_1357 [Amphiamblys sp. WSBS2006]|nr:MAG: uncharacterized protein A8A55_1357 [Amphiamblys sp. WSBS2006]